MAAATACQNGDHSSIKRHLSFNRKTTQSITNKGLHFDVFFSSPKVKILKKKHSHEFPFVMYSPEMVIQETRQQKSTAECFLANLDF